MFNEGTKDFALEKGTKAPEGAAAGATSGAVIGGALGWFAGKGLLAIPGAGPQMISEEATQHLTSASKNWRNL